MKKCIYCSKLYSGRGIKYCSYICYRLIWKSTIRLKALRARKGKSIIFSCQECGKEFKNYKSDKSKYCSRKCQYIAIGKNEQGNKHFNWKGGITPQINKRCNSPWWKQLRKEVYERDNYICQLCGIKCTSNQDLTKIQADHIIKEREGGSHSLDNLQTLCLSCHIQKDWQKGNYYATKSN